MVTLSVILHLAIGAIVWTSPRWLPRRRLPPPILVVDLVSLPPGAGALRPPSRKPKAQAPKKEQPAAPTAPEAKPKPKPAAVKLPEPEAKASAKPKPESPAPEPEAKPDPAAVSPPPQQDPGETAAPAGVGGEGPSGLGSKQQGGIGALDDEAFEFAWYRQALTQSLRAAWEKPDLRNLEAALRATVYFRVRRNGQIVGIRLATSSGLDLLDRSALRAVYDANPLPPLPYAYEGDSLGVHFYFELTPQ